MILIHNSSMLPLNLLIIELEDIISNLLNKVAMWMRLDIIFQTESLIYGIQGTLKTRDWKRRDWNTRDLKSMESVTIFKSKSCVADQDTPRSAYRACVATSGPVNRAQTKWNIRVVVVRSAAQTFRWSRVFFDFHVTLCTVISDFLHWTTWSFSDMLRRTCYY